MAQKKVRVAIIGVGNCASSLVQGVQFYKDAADDAAVPGIMHARLGGYHISDIEFVAAIDIDKNKVGKDLSEAIYTLPNNTYKFCDVPLSGVKVARGMTHDGLGKYLSQVIEKAPGQTADIGHGDIAARNTATVPRLSGAALHASIMLPASMNAYPASFAGCRRFVNKACALPQEELCARVDRPKC